MKEQILKLRTDGLSYNEICKRLKCPKSLVSYYCGDGQKTKTITRNQKRGFRLNVDKKMNNFKSKKLTDKTNDFQRRDGHHNGVRNITFTWKDLIEKFGNNPVCYLTGREINLQETSSYHFDHIVPATRGGSNNINNLGLAHKEANKAKSDMIVEEFLKLCKEVLEHHGYTVNKV
jgi:5-methylcytosine-specific restriction endonuclease McrA